MLMLMGRRDLGGFLGLHFTTSLGPLLYGARGVPNLFQNGFDVQGVAVGDRKDPHNIFAEEIPMGDISSILLMSPITLRLEWK